MPITVSIVEDNEQLRETLARVIGRAEGFRCLSQYGDAESALQGLPKDRPEIVLMDINLPGMNGVECVRRLKQSAPNIQALMLTVYEDTENIFNALAAGATGYLLKRTKGAELLEAIREVHRGGSPMTTHIARKVTQSFLRAGPSRRPRRTCPSANRRCSIALARVFFTRRSRTNWGSATRQSTPTSAASMKSSKSAPAPRRSPSS